VLVVCKAGGIGDEEEADPKAQNPKEHNPDTAKTETPEKPSATRVSLRR
jgi:hypothetical protein